MVLIPMVVAVVLTTTTARTTTMVMVEIFLGHVSNLLMALRKFRSMESIGFGTQSARGEI